MTDRLPDETAEREARLRKMTASNHARLAAVTAEEREARLQSDRVLVRHRQQQVMQAQLPLFLLSELRCLHFMHTIWLRWTRRDVHEIPWSQDSLTHFY